MSTTERKPSAAVKRRDALRDIHESGTIGGIHKTMLERFKTKAYIEKAKGGGWTLTKWGKAVMEGRIGSAGRGAVDLGSARYKAERSGPGGRSGARVRARDLAPHMTGDGVAAAKKLDREKLKQFEEEGAQLKAEWDKEQSDYRKAEVRILGPTGTTRAVKISRADGAPFHRYELEKFQAAGWEVHPGGTITAQVGKALKGTRFVDLSKFNPAGTDPLEKALGPVGETRAVVLVASGINGETLHQLRGAGYDINPAPKRIREGQDVKTNPAPEAHELIGLQKKLYILLKKGDWQIPDLVAVTGAPDSDVHKALDRLGDMGLAHPEAKTMFGSTWTIGGLQQALAFNPTPAGQKRPRAATGKSGPGKPKNMTKAKTTRKATAKAKKTAPKAAKVPDGIASDKVQPLKTQAAMKHRAITELGKLLKGTAKTPAKPQAKAPKPTVEKFTLTGRFNPTSSEDLARVWTTWTGTDPDQTLSFQVEHPTVSLKSGGQVTIPEHVVILGRVSKFISSTGRLADFGAHGPMIVTDAAAKKIWLLSAKPFHFDMEPSVIAYLARKAKFGDRETVEYVHAFSGRVRAVMAGQVGAMTGHFRITPRGLEG